MRNIILILVLCFSQVILAGEFFESNGYAIGGYDPVSYINENKAVQGKKAFEYLHKGSKFLFASLENKSVFEQDPEKYSPEFNGFCAFGVSNGYKAKTDPAAFTVLDGKLYLNYNKDIQKKWNSERESRIPLAIDNWKKIKSDKF